MKPVATFGKLLFIVYNARSIPQRAVTCTHMSLITKRPMVFMISHGLEGCAMAQSKYRNNYSL